MFTQIDDCLTSILEDSSSSEKYIDHYNKLFQLNYSSPSIYLTDTLENYFQYILNLVERYHALTQLSLAADSLIKINDIATGMILKGRLKIYNSQYYDVSDKEHMVEKPCFNLGYNDYSINHTLQARDSLAIFSRIDFYKNEHISNYFYTIKSSYFNKEEESNANLLLVGIDSLVKNFDAYRYFWSRLKRGFPFGCDFDTSKYNKYFVLQRVSDFNEELNRLFGVNYGQWRDLNEQIYSSRKHLIKLLIDDS